MVLYLQCKCLYSYGSFIFGRVEVWVLLWGCECCCWCFAWLFRQRGKITVQLDKWINPLESRSLGPVAVSVGGTLILPSSVAAVSFQWFQIYCPSLLLIVAPHIFFFPSVYQFVSLRHYANLKHPRYHPLRLFGQLCFCSSDVSYWNIFAIAYMQSRAHTALKQWAEFPGQPGLWPVPVDFKGGLWLQGFTGLV